MTAAGHTVVRVMIRGRVQGVGYRAWTADAAEARGLEGFVRNRRDGAVEAVFAGASVAVDEMLEACHGGPPGAQVSGIEKFEGADELLSLNRPGQRFSILPTA
jgi:acylphosphatase